MRSADVFGVSTDYLLGRTKQLPFDEFDLDGEDIAVLSRLCRVLAGIHGWDCNYSYRAPGKAAEGSKEVLFFLDKADMILLIHDTASGLMHRKHGVPPSRYRENRNVAFAPPPPPRLASPDKLWYSILHKRGGARNG